MNSADLFNLPEYSFTRIFDFLDSNTKTQLAATCKSAYSYLKNINEMNNYFSKVTKFILKNYEVIASSCPLTDLKRIFFSPIRLLMLGENHAHDAHRSSNSKLIESVWNKNSKLKIEGSKEGIERWKKEGQGQLKYLKKEIAATAESWDSMNEKCTRSIYEYVKLVRRAIEMSRDLFILFGDSSEVTYEQLKSFIIRYFTKEMLQKFCQVPKVREFKKNEILRQGNKKRNVIYKILLDTIMDAFNTELTARQAELDSFTKVRNESLKNHIVATLSEFHKGGVFIAGKAHLDAVLSEIKKFCHLHHFPFLFLFPKDASSASPPIRSLETKLSEEEKRNIEVEKFKTVLFRNSMETFLEDAEKEVDLEFLKKLLLNFDSRKVDANENHFGYWGLICLGLLLVESKKLERH